ncbi:MAG: hypothetical protein ACI9SP_004576 [Arenicella sp.]|jgi:hypothetical protein
MKYFINQSAKSHYCFIEGVNPPGAKPVSKETYQEFVAEVEELRNRVRDEVDSKRSVKLIGFEYKGMSMSATKDDHIGLILVDHSIKSGFFTSTNFEFENGSKLVLDSENIMELLSGVSSFRQTLFNPG